jgi:hypothetical protein
MPPSLRRRIGRLELVRQPLAVYPVYTVVSDDGEVQQLRMSDGTRFTGQDAAEKYRELSAFPMKAYLDFDPEMTWNPRNCCTDDTEEIGR